MRKCVVFFIFLSISFYSQNKILISGGRIDRPEFKNNRDSLNIRTLETINDDVLFCHKQKGEIKSVSKIFNDSIYKFSLANYSARNINFDVGFSNNLIFIKYKKTEKILVFKQSYDVKFCGYRKFKNELNLFFTIRNKEKKVYNFFIRVFSEKEKYTRLYLTYYNFLPSIIEIRNFCNSEKFWNDLKATPATAQ